MACATLKRTHEWDPMQSPSGRPLKRRRCMPAVSLFLNSSNSPQEKEENSPFTDVLPKVTPEQISNSLKDEIKHLQRRRQLNFSHHPSENECDISSACPSTAQQSLPSQHDQPLFTFQKVVLICERLIKERESKIREEYNQVLATKLSEQYDTFVKFTHDQIQKRFEGVPSYLS